MSANGPGIFEDDLAIEIRREFQAAVAAGLSAYAAAGEILERRARQLHDVDDGPVIYFALAELQLENSVISPRVRKKALTLINSGEAMQRWEKAGAKIANQRLAVLQDLRARLLAMP